MSDGSPTVDRPSSGKTSFDVAALAVAFAGVALLVDASVETYTAGAPVRWWVVGAAVAYAGVTAATLRMRVGWRTQVTIALVGVLGLIATTAWRPDGLADGIRLLGAPTTVVLSALTAAALLVAMVVVMRAATIPLVARLAVTLVALYGMVAFALGAWNGTAYHALFAGGSVWRAAPSWLQGGLLGGLIALPLSLLVSVAGGLARGARRWSVQPIVALALTMAIVVSGLTDAAGVRQSAVGFNVTAAGDDLSSRSAPADEQRVSADAVVLMKKVAADPAPSTSDVDRKATELGNDPTALFAYIRDQVRTEVYPGVLRGARGALMGGAGNAWDQSLLVAAMLRHHGREVRFARAHLAPADAAKIVARMFDDAEHARVAVRPSVQIADALQKQSRVLLARVQDKWQRSHADVVDALKRGALALGDRAVTDEMLSAEAGDHLWAEYRDADRWVPMDTVAGSRVGDTVASAAETFAEVPDALYHHVTIRVTVEARRDQTLETADVFRYQTTAAALHGAQVILSHQIDHEANGGWRARPLLAIDDQVFGAMSFTESGIQAVGAPQDDLIGQAHEAVGQLGRVTELFGSEPAKPAVPAGKQFAAESLAIDFADPAQHNDSVQREIVDRIGVVARAGGKATVAPLAPLPMAGEVPVQLASVYACAFTAGPLDPALVLRPLGARARAVEAALSLRERASRPMTSPEDSTLVNQVFDGLPAALSTTAATAHLMSQRLAGRLQTSGSAQTIFYEATPRLAIVSADLVLSSDGKSVSPSFAIDLRRNPVRTVGRSAPAALVRANLARGVLDAVIEDAVVPASPSPAPPTTISTVGIMDRAHADNVALVAVRDRSTARALPAAGDAQARMEADAGAGLAVVAAARQAPAAGDGGHTAWWSVDLATGETTGMLDNGLHGGQAIPERAAVSPVQRMGARAMLRVGPMDVAQAYKAGYQAGMAANQAQLLLGVVAGVAQMGVTAVVLATLGIIVGFFAMK